MTHLTDAQRKLLVYSLVRLEQSGYRNAAEAQDARELAALIEGAESVTVEARPNVQHQTQSPNHPAYNALASAAREEVGPQLSHRWGWKWEVSEPDGPTRAQAEQGAG